MDVNEWIRREIDRLELLPDPEYVADRPIEFPYGEFVYQGHVEDISSWRSIDTIGDGSCLIHSIVQLLSPAYRSLSTRDKIKVIASFRRFLSRELDLTYEQREELRGTGFLEDEIGNVIASYLGYGLIMLQSATYKGVPVPTILCQSISGRPTLIIENQGTELDRIRPGSMSGRGRHFQSVIQDQAVTNQAQWVSSSHLCQHLQPTIIHLIERGVEITSRLKNSHQPPSAPSQKEDKLTSGSDSSPEKPKQRWRCDTPKVLAKYPNSLTLEKAKALAKTYHISSSLNKPELCEALKTRLSEQKEEADIVHWYVNEKRMLGAKQRRTTRSTQTRRKKSRTKRSRQARRKR